MILQSFWLPLRLLRSYWLEWLSDPVKTSSEKLSSNLGCTIGLQTDYVLIDCCEHVF